MGKRVKFPANLVVRVSDNLKNDLEDIADLRNIDVSDHVREVLERSVRQWRRILEADKNADNT